MARRTMMIVCWCIPGGVGFDAHRSTPKPKAAINRNVAEIQNQARRQAARPFESGRFSLG